MKKTKNELHKEWRQKNYEHYLNKRNEREFKKRAKTCEICTVKYLGNRGFCSNKCNILGNTKINEKDCWEWQKGLNHSNYGQAKDYDDLKTKGTHRISYKVFKGEIPKGMFVCHSCDNPKCCNPDHLWLGNHKDNAQDALKKGRLSLNTLTYRRKM